VTASSRARLLLPRLGGSLFGIVAAGALGAACGSEPTAAPTPTPTFHADVKPLLESRCLGCHVEGGIGPFALTDPATVVALREPIRAAVASRSMPPWFADEGCADYEGDVSLSDAEIETIVRWADEGAPMGTPTAAAAVEAAPGLARIDRELTLPEPYTPRAAPDDYRCFVLDWPETRDRFVTGYDVHPGNRAIVHHVIVYAVPPHRVAEVDALDAAEDGPGYTCFGGPGGRDASRDYAWLGSWAPGGGANGFGGAGIRVVPGSKLVVQLHYNVTSPSPAPDASTIALQLEDAVALEGRIMPFTNPLWLDSDQMTIPAGKARWGHDFAADPSSFVNMPDGFTIWSSALHMHQLGRGGGASVVRADGSRSCLLKLRDYDFGWQTSYRLTRPEVFRPGDKLRIECEWDNSAENQPMIDGVRAEPRQVTWGEGTSDEMCLGVFFVTPL
jgi:hypothetical protein